GQDRWAESFPACGGDLQSPVDVETSSAQHDPSLTPVRPLGYSQPGNDLFTLTNNGHTVEMSLPGTMALEGLPWRFSAVQLHLHWGSGGQGGGAEHLIDGQSTNAELHVVHYNSDLFPNVSAALSQQGGLAVLAVLIQTGEETNPAYQNIFNYLGNVRYTGQKVSVPPFNVQMLLPKQLDRFYRYNGSLTTPPCYQSVLWTVFSERVTVSYTQMERLQTALVAGAPGSAHVVPLQDNFRGTQPLNGRLILTSFPPGE
ncbi:CAH14 anhydrase, partial [Amia calva]|nr:CAH14 anhydrase [Amia calva]